MGNSVVLGSGFFVSMLWLTTLALGVAYGLSIALSRRPARAHYCLTLGLAASFVLPVAFIAVSHAGLGVLPPATVTQNTETPSLRGESPQPAAPSLTHVSPLESWGSRLEASVTAAMPWVTGLWLGVGALLAVRLFLTLGFGLRLLAQAQPLVNERIHGYLVAAMRLVGVTRTPITFTTDRVHCPAIWCWAIHPSVLLPSAMAGDAADPGRWKSVFSHELAHLKRRDHLAAIMAEVVCCVLWWHPLAWLCRQRLNALSDAACDQWVVASGQPADVYAETLLGMIPQARSLTALSMVSGKHGLKQRLTAILDVTPRPPGAGRRWVFTTTVIALFLVALTACMQTQSGSESRIAPSNLLTNASMEDGASAPDSWSQNQSVDGVEYLWDRSAAKSGKASLCLKKTSQRFFPIAEWTQTIGAIQVDGNRELHLKLSAWIKAENVSKATLDVHYTDASGEWKHQWAAYIGAKEDGNPPANHDWQQYSGNVDVPPGAMDITVGLQIYGPGTVWFDDMSLEIAAVGDKEPDNQTHVGFAR
ncbi:MAG: M56 family metallopeptidase [Candidatus Hydrogenedentales bacterium]|jgi:beta-lactamase regulating signal transducer with metallopeptidase domain